jgi:hypothetical protein
MASDPQVFPDSLEARDQASSDAGFIKFYGLYWHKRHVTRDKKKELLGKPSGWIGQGKPSKDATKWIFR